MKSPDEWLTGSLLSQTAAFSQTVTGADPAAKVPTCPEWQLRDLVAHIGQAPRWAASILRNGPPDTLPDPREEDAGPPESWPDWLEAGARELVDAATVPDMEVWTFLGPGPARFWVRRILCDLAVHRFDAAYTVGLPCALPQDLAAETITEGLTLLRSPIPQLEGLRGTGQTIRLNPVERDLTGWLVTRAPDGVTWEPASTGGDLVITGRVQDLVLVLTGRIPAAAVDLHGDKDLLDHWLANATL
ncbi:maleylpyruvate isomerase family mycothiol-dependent enzyme [Nonomuraea typhae]|uniref:Maleylpyruvate isomerase family mycothiol-dependent enzyme n=1 Tax=Nonomuraea typhae TaxID=2603600 RepID=A0ABW7Z7K2_9ACTN